MGCHSLLQGIFPSQWSNPGLLHFRQISSHLSHQGSQPHVTQTELKRVFHFKIPHCDFDTIGSRPLTFFTPASASVISEKWPQSLFSGQKRYSFPVIASNLLGLKQSPTTVPSVFLHLQMQLQYGFLVFQNATFCCWLWLPLRDAAKTVQQKCLGHRPCARQCATCWRFMDMLSKTNRGHIHLHYGLLFTLTLRSPSSIISWYKTEF